MPETVKISSLVNNHFALLPHFPLPTTVALAASRRSTAWLFSVSSTGGVSWVGSSSGWGACGVSPSGGTISSSSDTVSFGSCDTGSTTSFWDSWAEVIPSPSVAHTCTGRSVKTINRANNRLKNCFFILILLSCGFVGNAKNTKYFNVIVPLRE